MNNAKTIINHTTFAQFARVTSLTLVIGGVVTTIFLYHSQVTT